MHDKFDTRLIHGGDTESTTDSVAPAIEMTTTFVRGDPRDEQEFIYSRTNNPNRQALERRIASLENGFDAVSFATGSAASLALFQSLPQNSHILVTHDAYFGTVKQLNGLVTQMGHTVSAIDTTQLHSISLNWRDNTRLVWLETPSNPQMRISDIKAICKLAHLKNAKVCCDNTLATSVLQNPLELGADFSMHSSTKFFGGHSDVLGGVVIAKRDSQLLRQLRDIQGIGGATPAPFDCWLLLRSIATLGLRVRHQSNSAAILAERLDAHPDIEQVLYAGRKQHPQRELIDSQMSGGGALLSLLISGGVEQAIAIARNTKLFKQATSLGGVESLIEHRHSVEGSTSVSPDNLLRLSVGLEDIDDLFDDLSQALAASHSPR